MLCGRRERDGEACLLSRAGGAASGAFSAMVPIKLRERTTVRYRHRQSIHETSWELSRYLSMENVSAGGPASVGANCPDDSLPLGIPYGPPVGDKCDTDEGDGCCCTIATCDRPTAISMCPMPSTPPGSPLYPGSPISSQRCRYSVYLCRMYWWMGILATRNTWRRRVRDEHGPLTAEAIRRQKQQFTRLPRSPGWCPRAPR